MNTPTVSQFGFNTASGALANIVDENDATGWAPLADEFTAYSAPFLVPTTTVLNVGNSFPALQFDFGEPVRIGFFNVKCASIYSLGAAVLLGSNNPATSVANTMQSGDVLLGQYTAEEIVSGNLLETAAVSNQALKFRYFRLLQRQQS